MFGLDPDEFAAIISSVVVAAYVSDMLACWYFNRRKK